MLLLVLFSGCSSDNTGGDQVNAARYTQIPDIAFEQFLIDQGFDDLADSRVLTANIEGVEQLDMTDIPVASLAGLEDFKALRKFLVRSTALSSFDPTPNTNLTYLSTNGCTNLSALNVTTLTRLDTLYMSNNNSITTLDVSQNNRIRSLHVIASNLEQIALPQGQVDFFTDLIIVNSKIQALDLSAYPNLITLELYDNQIIGLDVTAQSRLSLLDCSGNPLQSLNLASGGNATFLQLVDARTGQGTLDCIQIDPGFTPPVDGSWQKDEQTQYSDDCP
jgi:Leucine-rich repeat (LRR) protein